MSIAVTQVLHDRDLGHGLLKVQKQDTPDVVVPCARRSTPEPEVRIY